MTILTKDAIVYVIGVIVAAIGVGICNAESPWQMVDRDLTSLPPDCIIALAWPIWVAGAIIASPFWIPGTIADGVRWLKKRHEQKKAVEELLKHK